MGRHPWAAAVWVRARCSPEDGTPHSPSLRPPYPWAPRLVRRDSRVSGIQAPGGVVEGVGCLAQVGTGALGLLRIRSSSRRGRCEPLALCFSPRRAILVHICSSLVSSLFHILIPWSSATADHSRSHTSSFTFAYIINSLTRACGRASLAPVPLASRALRRVRACALSPPVSLSRLLCVSPASRSRAAHSCGGGCGPPSVLLPSLFTARRSAPFLTSPSSSPPSRSRLHATGRSGKSEPS